MVRLRKTPPYTWVGYKHERMPYTSRNSAIRERNEYRRKGYVSTIHYFKGFGWYVYYAPIHKITPKVRKYFKLKKY